MAFQKTGVAALDLHAITAMLHVMATGTRGRPSKGERRVVVTRLPMAVDNLVVAEAKARGISKSEVVAALVARQLGVSASLPDPQPTLDTLSA